MITNIAQIRVTLVCGGGRVPTAGTGVVTLTASLGVAIGVNRFVLYCSLSPAECACYRLGWDLATCCMFDLEIMI